MWTTFAFGDIDNDGRDDMLRGAIELTSSPLTWYSRRPRLPTEYGGFGYSWEQNWPAGERIVDEFMNYDTAPLDNPLFHIHSISAAPVIIDLNHDGMIDIVSADIRYDISVTLDETYVQVVYYRHARASNPPPCAMDPILTPQCGVSGVERPGACTVTPLNNGACVCAAGFAGLWNASLIGLGCARCAPGRYTAQHGAFSCAACPRGRYSSKSGATMCAGACSPGHFGNLTEQSTSSGCFECHQGTFSSFEGIDACTGKCDIGKYGTQPGATNNSVCVSCPPKHVAITGQSACSKCEEGFSPDQYNNYCSACPATTFRSLSTGDCIACPASRAVCSNGRLLFARATWYPPSTTSFDTDLEMHACFNDVSCDRSADKMQVSCAMEKGYGGPLCGACDGSNANGHGTFARSGRSCALCWPPWANWLAITGAVVALLFVLMYLVVRYDFAAPVGDYSAS